MSTNTLMIYLIRCGWNGTSLSKLRKGARQVTFCLVNMDIKAPSFTECASDFISAIWFKIFHSALWHILSLNLSNSHTIVSIESGAEKSTSIFGLCA